MILAHRVALDGVQLDSIDDRILISRVETADGKESISTVDAWGPYGSRVTKIHRSSLDITIKFRIRLRKRSMSEREEVLEKVNAWAYAGGWLTTNNKPGRQIRVFRAQAVGVGDPWDWTKEYSLIMRACGVPYWQQSTPDAASVDDKVNASLSVVTAGSETGVMDITFDNTSGGTINSFEISNGENTISFTSLGLADGERLVIDHHDNGKRCILRMRIRNTSGNHRSVLSKRSVDSSDDLYTTPGSHQVTMSAGGRGDLTVKIYGRFA